jgi:hypothetical protein
MELLVLDASGSWLAPGNGTSGYLLLDGFNLWIDLGTGTLARLGEHIPDHSVDAAVISYAQPDNRVDLHMLYYARAFHPECIRATRCRAMSIPAGIPAPVITAPLSTKRSSRRGSIVGSITGNSSNARPLEDHDPHSLRTRVPLRGSRPSCPVPHH